MKNKGENSGNLPGLYYRPKTSISKNSKVKNRSLKTETAKLFFSLFYILPVVSFLRPIHAINSLPNMSDQVEIIQLNYEAKILRNEELHTFTVPNLNIPKCGSCGELIFTEEVDRQIEKAFDRILRH